ncbi:MAG: alpha/beta fold hydrolase, partial [Pseudomonadota bacterium]
FPGPSRFMFPAFAKALQFNPLTPYLFSQGAKDEARVRRLIVSTGSMPPVEQIDAYAALLKRPGHVAGALGMMANWDLGGLESALPSLDRRAVLIAAANDRAVPPGDASRIVKRMKNAEHVLVPDYGHLVHEETPEAIAKIVRNHAQAMGLG